MDTQQIEILGRHRLIEALIADGLEIANPLRDRGVDLICYRSPEMGSYSACPIQLKVSSREAFSLNRKYKCIAGLRLVYVWNVGDAASTSLYVLNFEEAEGVLKRFGYAKTQAWLDKGYYATTRPSVTLKKYLAQFRVKPGSWAERLGL